MKTHIFTGAAMYILMLAPQSALADTTTLLCNLHSNFSCYNERPTEVILDETGGAVTVHFSATHMRNPGGTSGGADGRGGTAESDQTYQANFGPDVITFGPWTLNRTTGEMTQSSGWWPMTCDVAKKKF